MLSIKRFYVELDDGYEPDSVKVNTMQLIDQHKVIAIAGNAGTPMAAIAAPLAFTGSPKDQLATKRKAMQVDFAAQQNQQHINMASNLIDLQQVISGATPEEINEKIDRILKDALPNSDIRLKSAEKQDDDS